MKKTRYEHLNSLPEPFRSKAINNYFKRLNIKHVSEIPTNVKEYSSDIDHAISSAFNWSSTPEGYDYWSNLITGIYQGKIKVKEQTENYSIY